MVNFVEWVKSRKLVLALVLIVLYLLFKGSTPVYQSSNYKFGGPEMMAFESVSDSFSSTLSRGEKSVMPVAPGAAPRPDVPDRKVVTNSNVSVVVKNVRETVQKISDEVKNKKGYVVNKYINTPEVAETGTIVVRVPSAEIDSFLDSVRNFSTKVVSENIASDDITDSYYDVQERLNVLVANKTRFEDIMKKAENVDEILRVQQNIFNLQDQIDNLKGQLKYMDGTSTTSLVTISMSTDEISLPYTPESPFRPQVIFKEAVRSLVKDLRWFATLIIWGSVYAAIWLPVAGVLMIGYVWYKKRFVQK